MLEVGVVSKKFLLRMNEEQFQVLMDLAKSKSLNQYINEIIDTHIDNVEGRSSKVKKIVIDDLSVNEVREAVTVTQKSWYMDLLMKYNIYFFSPTKIVTPMMNILFYGDSECDPANCISHVGKVSHIYRHVHRNDILSIPELQGVLNDPDFGEIILSWDDYQIVILSDVRELPRPIPLTKEYINHPRIIVNRTTSMVKVLTATKMDDLFID